MKKKYIHIILQWIFRIESPSLNRKVRFKDIFNKKYLG